jgi:hypothetical protein
MREKLLLPVKNDERTPFRGVLSSFSKMEKLPGKRLLLREVGNVFSEILVTVTYDVIFSEIGSVLDLDDLQGELSRIGEPVNLVFVNKGALSLVKKVFPLLLPHQSGTANDNPVFGPVMVILKAEAFSGKHPEAFNLYSFRLVENTILSPMPGAFRSLPELPAPLVFQSFHNAPHSLRFSPRSDIEGIRGIHHKHVLHSRSGDKSAAALDHAVLTIQRQDISFQDVSMIVSGGGVVKGVPASEVGPFRMEGHHAHIFRLFHNAEVDGKGGKLFKGFHQGSFPLAKELADLWKMFIEGRCHISQAEKKDSPIPEILSRVDIFLGTFRVGLFHEGLHFVPPSSVPARLDVAVSRFRGRGNHSESDQTPRFESVKPLKNSLPKGLFILHGMIAGTYEEGSFRIQPLFKECDHSKGDGGSGVAPQRLLEKKGFFFMFKSELPGLVQYLGTETFSSHHPDPGTTEAIQATKGFLQKTFASSEGEELLGHFLPRKGPEAGTSSSRKNESMYGMFHSRTSFMGNDDGNASSLPESRLGRYETFFSAENLHYLRFGEPAVL